MHEHKAAFDQSYACTKPCSWKLGRCGTLSNFSQSRKSHFWIHTHVRSHTFIINTHTHMHTHVCSHALNQTHPCKGRCTPTCSLSLSHTHTHTHTCTHMCAHIYYLRHTHVKAGTHPHALTHTHTHTHAHTHTHTLTHTQKLSASLGSHFVLKSSVEVIEPGELKMLLSANELLCASRGKTPTC